MGDRGDAVAGDRTSSTTSSSERKRRLLVARRSSLHSNPLLERKSLRNAVLLPHGGAADHLRHLTSVLQELQAHWRPREPQARNRLAQILNTIATEDDAQRQAADTELTQLRTMIGSLQDSLADFQKK